MKIAVITGASRGLGRSTALNCAKRGTGVILTYNSHPEGAEDGRAKARVDFACDFGHEIGLLDISVDPAGLIARIDADLE